MVPGPAGRSCWEPSSRASCPRPHGRGPLRHGNQSTFPELAMVGSPSSHRVSCSRPLPPHRGHLLSRQRSGQRHLARRLTQLYGGLVLYGASSALPGQVGPRPGTLERAAPGPRGAHRPVHGRRADPPGRGGAAAVDPSAPATGPRHDLERAGDRRRDGRRAGRRARRPRLDAAHRHDGGGDRPERRGDRAVHRPRGSVPAHGTA